MKILCDTHVHCYRFDQLEQLLDSALTNFNKHSDSDAKVLFFTDGERDQTWIKIIQEIEMSQANNKNKCRDQWQFVFNSNDGFIHAVKHDSTLLLAPAKQVNSAMRLEYLLLGCQDYVADGLADDELIKTYAQTYAIICPWGVGKWLGARGKLLLRLMQTHGDSLLLGDNGGRPRLWFWVPQFKQSATKPINGTDPLPINGELDRIATFGIELDLKLDSEQNSELDSELKNKALTLSNVINAIKAGNHQNYGKGVSVSAFLRAQIKMRLA